MKNLFLILTLFLLEKINAQRIPNLTLKENLNEEIILPLALNKNDVCIIMNYSGGWTAFDKNIYYIFNTNGDLKIYEEEFPKPYLKNADLKKSIKELKVSSDTKNKLWEIINSKKIKEFQKYSQVDFKIKQKNKSIAPPPCIISDATAYKIWFIQNNKQNSYGYYAPEYFLEKCPDKTINKAVLKEFLEMLKEIWSVKIQN